MAKTKQQRKAATRSAHRADAHGPFRQSVRWRNFRGFEDTDDVPLPDLTIIIGPNNSGKSSLIAPLLLMKQTMTSTDSSRPLITKGAYTNVGSYSEYVHNGDTSRVVTFGLRYHGHDAARKLSPVEKFDDPPGEIEFSVRATPTGGLELSDLKIFDMYRRLYVQRSLQEKGAYSIGGPLATSPSVDDKLLKVLKVQRPSGFLFGPIIPEWDANNAGKRKVLDTERKGIDLYNAIAMSVSGELRRMLGSLAYIGPMRERPARFYEHTGESPTTVGPRGEHAYEVFFRERDQLQAKLNAAVRKLKFADAVECEGASNQSEVFTVKLAMNGLKVNLADAGFGVSQLLPILIQGFLKPSSNRYGRLIVKQPEIHLNPAQQSAFAELVVEMLPRSSMIVETHSEHFLLTIRRLIAEGRIPSDEVSLCFVENATGGSTLRHVPISPKGHIAADDWPEGFFNDSVREAMALASAQVGIVQTSGGRGSVRQPTHRHD